MRREESAIRRFRRVGPLGLTPPLLSLSAAMPQPPVPTGARLTVPAAIVLAFALHLAGCDREAATPVDKPVKVERVTVMP